MQLLNAENERGLCWKKVLYWWCRCFAERKNIPSPFANVASVTFRGPPSSTNSPLHVSTTKLDWLHLFPLSIHGWCRSFVWQGPTQPDRRFRCNQTGRWCDKHRAGLPVLYGVIQSIRGLIPKSLRSHYPLLFLTKAKFQSVPSWYGTQGINPASSVWDASWFRIRSYCATSPCCSCVSDAKSSEWHDACILPSGMNPRHFENQSVQQSMSTLMAVESGDCCCSIEMHQLWMGFCMASATEGHYSVYALMYRQWPAEIIREGSECFHEKKFSLGRQKHYQNGAIWAGRTIALGYGPILARQPNFAVYRVVFAREIDFWFLEEREHLFDSCKLNYLLWVCSQTKIFLDRLQITVP